MRQQLVPVHQAWKIATVTTFLRYDRPTLGCGIGHSGAGNFHWSHPALYRHEYLQAHPEHWMIHGFGPVDADRPLVRAMNAQEGPYTLTERSGSGDHAQGDRLDQVVDPHTSPRDGGSPSRSVNAARFLLLTERGEGYPPLVWSFSRVVTDATTPVLTPPFTDSDGEPPSHGEV